MGTRYKTRTPIVSAEHGGEDCSGSTSQKEDCELEKCSGIKALSYIELEVKILMHRLSFK